MARLVFAAPIASVVLPRRRGGATVRTAGMVPVKDPAADAMGEALWSRCVRLIARAVGRRRGCLRSLAPLPVHTFSWYGRRSHASLNTISFLACASPVIWREVVLRVHSKQAYGFVALVGRSA